MSCEILSVPMLEDNYSWALIDHEQGAIAIIDPPEVAPVEALVERLGLKLGLILLTHHHADHIAGADTLRRITGAPIYGAGADQHRLPSLDRSLAEGDVVRFGHHEGQVLETPGHTLGHISFYFPSLSALFCGDTLFSLGCGRLLEGTPAQMFASLERFKQLPADTLVCCGHEYTAANGRYALSVDPDNAALVGRMAEVTSLRAESQATLPAILGDELAANPFLRAADVAAFAALRSGKDGFR